jgi:hypothetical protein
VLDKLHPHRAAIEAALVERERSLFNLDRRSISMTSPRLTLKARLQISEFPAGDFGRRFRLKPTGRFGPKRHPIPKAFGRRLERTAAVGLILSCHGL